MSTVPTGYDSLRQAALASLPHIPALDSAGKLCQQITSTVVPTLLKKLPEKVSSFVKDYFVAVPATIFAKNLLVDQSFISVNLVTSLVSLGLSELDRNGAQKSVIEDANFALLVLHTIKFGYNATKVLYSQDISSIWNAAADFAIATRCAMTLANRGTIATPTVQR